MDSIQSGDSAVFDPILTQFPIDFHEPFYRNYLENPMEALFEKAGMEKAQSAVGYVSKVGWARV